MWITQFYLQTHTCLYHVVRQRAPRLNEQFWWSLLFINQPREDERLSWYTVSIAVQYSIDIITSHLFFFLVSAPSVNSNNSRASCIYDKTTASYLFVQSRLPSNCLQHQTRLLVLMHSKHRQCTMHWNTSSCMLIVTQGCHTFSL